jgi:transcriptional regulator with XRE-family HTH domain
MAKRLTTQDKIKRARAEGYSRKQLAKAFGVSVSSIGRAERGQTSGATIKAQAEQFYKLGKRAKASVVSGSASLPSAKPAPKTAPKKTKEAPALKIVSPLERAEGKLAALDGDTMVVVQVTLKSDGMTSVLFARGGIEVSEIRGNLKESIEEQFGRQYRNDFDWDDVVDIKIEEY